MSGIKVPFTDPLLPPGMSDRDTEPVPGDDSDSCCSDCGAPLNADDRCPDEHCGEYQERMQAEAEWRDEP
jgi:hypothetical protein